MKIAYALKEGRRGVLAISVDGEEWQEVHTSIFGRKPSLPSNCLSLEELQNQFAILEYRCAKQYALKRLSIASQPSTVLFKGLVEHLVSENTAQKIVAECQHLGYINDRDWVASVVRRSMARNLGPKAIAMKIKSKGISGDVAQEMIGQLDNSALQQERIQHLLKTRYRSKDLTNFREKEKVVGALFRKGFDIADIQNAIRSLRSL